MNRLLYVMLISAITIFGFTMYQHKDIGHVSFSFAGVAFETNLVVFTAALFCVLFVLLVFFRILQSLKNMLISIGHQRKQRQDDKARLALSQGLIEYAEGRFEKAEKILLQQVKNSDNRLLLYITAARAAQQLGAHDRRDEYLRQAHQEYPEADIAIGLTKAELQLAHEQNEQALATLTQLNQLTANHTYVISLLANTYKQLHDWDNLKNTLPSLKKFGHLSTESILSFEISICNGQLSNLTKNRKPQLLVDYWKNIPHHLKTLPDVVEHYARMLIIADAAGEAEQVLRLYLNKNWEERIIILYSELDVMVDNKQLEMAEAWLKDHQHNAWLLLALGKMCGTRSLWGKAKNYLTASISIHPMPENYLMLARLLEEHMEKTEEAQKYYRQGLRLLVGDYTQQIQLRTTEESCEIPQLQIVNTQPAKAGGFGLRLKTG